MRCLAEFRRLVYEHYLRLGRHDLPWRMTRNPHRILVAEVMLRQTRVQRVLAKYEPFLDRFPDIASLSKAPLQGLLRSWSGLEREHLERNLERLEKEGFVEREGGRRRIAR